MPFIIYVCIVQMYMSFLMFPPLGLESDKSVTLEPTDLEGPMPSQVVQARDWLLWLAWTFVIICSVFGFVRSQYGQSVITRMRVLWQEHQHIE